MFSQNLPQIEGKGYFAVVGTGTCKMPCRLINFNFSFLGFKLDVRDLFQCKKLCNPEHHIVVCE